MQYAHCYALCRAQHRPLTTRMPGLWMRVGTCGPGIGVVFEKLSLHLPKRTLLAFIDKYLSLNNPFFIENIQEICSIRQVSS